jgi:hypothetical protein
MAREYSGFVTIDPHSVFDLADSPAIAAPP